jgi:serine/threonine protein kinase
MASALSFANQNLGIFQGKGPEICKALGRIDIKTRTHVGKYVILDRKEDPQLHERQFGLYKTAHFCVSLGLGSGQFTVQIALRSKLYCSQFQNEKRVFALLKGVKGTLQPLLIQEQGEFEYLIAELCNQGDLCMFLTNPNTVLYAININLIGYSIVCALRECHARGVLHRDLKIDNIVVNQKDDGTFEILLIDFGFAYLMNEDSEAESKSSCGSSMYFSPEDWAFGKKTGKLLSNDYSRDLWPVGAVLYSLVVGCLPYTPIYNANKAIIGVDMHPKDSFPLGLFQSEINDIIYQNLQNRPSLPSIQERMYSILKNQYPNYKAIKDLVKPDAVSSLPLAKWASEALDLEKFLNVVGSTESKTSGGTILDIIHSYLMLNSDAASSSSPPQNKMAANA